LTLDLPSKGVKLRRRCRGGEGIKIEEEERRIKKKNYVNWSHLKGGGALQRV
jgi:hypothetical protein